MAAQKQLDISHLDKVLQVLKKYQYAGTSYYRFGLSLGLSAATLDVIEKDHRDDTARCLMECLKKWLSQTDDVKSKGGPSWYTLIAALRAIGENAVADGIDREKHPACVILTCHKSDQSLQDLLPSLTMLLQKEGITKEILPTCTEATMVLAAVQEAVCFNHVKLERFAVILQLFPGSVSVGDAILKEYWKEFPDDSSETLKMNLGGKPLEIRIPRAMTPEFQAIRNKWAEMMSDVGEVLLTVSIEDLKSYVQMCRPDLKPQLVSCSRTQDILQLISEKCSLINITLLEGIVNRFKIEEAKLLIQQYKESVKKFCQEPLRQCLNKKFLTVLPLECKSITFLVDRRVDDFTLKDIDDLVAFAFEEQEVEIFCVKQSKSFTITCSFPLALSESLIKTALKNLELLKKKVKGLLQLTIGYSIVYRCDDHIKSTSVSSEWATAVYTSRGTLEQMLVSLSVQLANSQYQLVTMEEKHKEELTSLNEMKLKEQLAQKSETDKKMMVYQAKLKKEIVSLHEKQTDLKNQLVIMKQKHEEGQVNEKVVTEQIAGKDEASKEVHVVRLQEEIELLTEQLALFISEKDTDTKVDDTDIPKQSLQENEIKCLKISLAEHEEEVQTLKEVKEVLQKQVDDLREEQRRRLNGIEKVFHGTVFHCVSPERVDVLDDAIVGVTKSGKIAFVEEGSKLEHLQKKFDFNDWQIHQLMDSQFLMPGFVDTHTHAPQFHLTNLGYDKPLQDWLQNDIFPCEMKFDSVSHAKKTYPQVVKRTLTNGTTTASYYATIHFESTKELCKVIARNGQRALVGKVNMDVNSPPDYKEHTEQSVSATLDFIEFVNGMELPLIQPVITPRYLPSCSRELLQELSQVAKKNSLRVQSILCQRDTEISYTRKSHPGHNNCTEIFAKLGLLTEKTYMAHCIHMEEEELQLLKENNVGIAHCPNTNNNSVMDVRDRLNRGIKVGLGTNIPAKSSPSILGVINHAMQASKMRAGNPITLDEALYMGTLGGAQVLNLDDQIGNFKVGKQFDALIVDVKAVGKQLVTGDTLCEIYKKDILRKFIYDGDDRNIVKVFVAGREVISKIDSRE